MPPRLVLLEAVAPARSPLVPRPQKMQKNKRARAARVFFITTAFSLLFSFFHYSSATIENKNLDIRGCVCVCMCICGGHSEELVQATCVHPRSLTFFFFRYFFLCCCAERVFPRCDACSQRRENERSSTRESVETQFYIAIITEHTNIQKGRRRVGDNTGCAAVQRRQ